MSFPGEDWMPNTSAQSGDGKKVKISPVCTKCRSKHLKCDGGPVCSRCRGSGSECVFVPSRRGMRPSRVSSPSVGLLEHPPTLSYPTHQSYSQPLPTSSLTPSGTSWPLGVPPALPMEGTSLFPQWLSVSTLSRSESLNLIQNFYVLSRYAHQFALAQDVLLRRHNEIDVQPLQAVIEYLGWTSLLTSQRSDIRHHAESLCFAANIPANAYTVQAQLLLALHLFEVNDHQRAVQLLQRSRLVATSIGMNQPDFPLTNCADSDGTTHSWQATWQALLQYCNVWILENDYSSIQMVLRSRGQSSESVPSPQHPHPHPAQVPRWAMLASQTSMPSMGWSSTSFAPISSVELPRSYPRQGEHKEFYDPGINEPRPGE